MAYRFVAVTLALLVLAGATPLSHAHADVVTDWNIHAVNAIKTAAVTPNVAGRAIAIVQLSVYDAVTTVEKKYAPYHAKLTVDGPVSAEAAAAAAAHYALAVLFPTQQLDLNKKLSASLAKIDKGEARTNGVALGEAAAADILSLRTATADGSANVPAYPGSLDPGKWRPTPPGNLAAQDPGWGDVTPFAVPIADAAFTAPVPPAITAAAYAKDFEEVRALGAKTGSTRTADQTIIGGFWIQPTYIPYNAIARQLSNLHGLSLFENARLLALLNIAIADSRVVAWHSKFLYGTWRPVTAISTATDDGNVGTTEDAAWGPFIDTFAGQQTPNHPEYPSGHSTTGAAAATLLANYFGDEQGFTVASDSLADTTRAFASLWQSALENGRSRIYIGVHFQYANAAGLNLGKSVGQYVADHELLALPPPVIVDAGSDAAAEDEDAGAVVTDAGALDSGVAADAGPATLDAAVAADSGSAVVDAGTQVDSGEYVVDGGTDGHGHKKDNDCSVANVGSQGSRTTLAGFALVTIGLVLRRRATRKRRA